MIRIVPPDSSWPLRFGAEATRIRAALGALAVRIEHVGSTAVPGLAAKPVIDIQVSVGSLAGMARCAEPLARLGYAHVALGAIDRVYPFFQQPAHWPSTHHLHLCVVDSDEERRHLAFRDHLRSHPAVAAEYARLKHRLAAEHDGATLESRERYSLSKTDFVESALKAARAIGAVRVEASF